jgi:hypothetical protein
MTTTVILHETPDISRENKNPSYLFIYCQSVSSAAASNPITACRIPKSKHYCNFIGFSSRKNSRRWGYNFLTKKNS